MAIFAIGVVVHWAVFAVVILLFCGGYIVLLFDIAQLTAFPILTPDYLSLCQVQRYWAPTSVVNENCTIDNCPRDTLHLNAQKQM